MENYSDRKEESTETDRLSTFDKIVDYCWGQADIPERNARSIWLLSCIGGIIIGIWALVKTDNPNGFALFVIGVIGAGLSYIVLAGAYCLIKGRIGGVVWWWGSIVLLAVIMYIVITICKFVFGF